MNGNMDGWTDGGVVWGHMSPVNISPVNLSPVACHLSVTCSAALQCSAGQWHRQYTEQQNQGLMDKAFLIGTKDYDFCDNLKFELLLHKYILRIVTNLAKSFGATKKK